MAGLSAAETLAEQGRRRVVLVEPTGRFGGVLDTVRHDGWLIERSADNFLAARPEGLALVDRLEACLEAAERIRAFASR